MSDFFNTYPYTDFHELNLDWVISSLKEIQNSYQSIIDWIENDAQNYNDLVSQINLLKSDTLYLQSQINAEKQRLDNEVATINGQITSQYNRITLEYTALYSNILTLVDSQLTALNTKIDQQKLDLIQLINDENTAVMGYVNSELQNFIDNLPDYEHLIVYNPVRGIQTTVQVAIDDLYGYFNMYALTAQEYDDLQLTAEDYDRYGLTAHQYDTEGKNYLGTNSFYMMRSPFTGEMAPVSEVVLALFNLHRTTALTAAAYDALDMTATYYDGLLMEALDYDLNGI